MSFLTCFNYTRGNQYNISYRGRAPQVYTYLGYTDCRHVFNRTIPGTTISDTYRFIDESPDILITPVV